MPSRLVATRRQYSSPRYIVVLIDPQGLKVWIERPCKHPSCFWAKASKPMIIKATKTPPATRFCIMAVTPRGWQTTH